MLLRLAFWLAVLVFLLPSDPQQQARLYATAATALQRATTFCDRNVNTCAVGAAAWANFVRKAEFALRLVGDLLGAQQTPGALPQQGKPGRAGPRGTLSPSRFPRRGAERGGAG